VEEDVVAALDLFCAGKQCYMLSNTNPVHKDYIIDLVRKKYGSDLFSKWFRHCYFSDEIGLLKPDSRIYESVNSGMGGPEPSTCLFIDDSSANIQAARQFGWQAIHADRRLPNILAAL